MGIKFTGADDYINMVNNMTKEVPQKAREIVKHYTVATQAQAVRLEPVKSGYLRRSTTVKITNSNTSSVGVVTANAFNRGYNYGARQEYDTKLKHPNGGQALFMKTAFEAQRNGFIRDMKGALK